MSHMILTYIHSSFNRSYGAHVIYCILFTMINKSDFHRALTRYNTKEDNKISNFTMYFISVDWTKINQSCSSKYIFCRVTSFFWKIWKILLLWIYDERERTNEHASLLNVYSSHQWKEHEAIFFTNVSNRTE